MRTLAILVLFVGAGAGAYCYSVAKAQKPTCPDRRPVLVDVAATASHAPPAPGCWDGDTCTLVACRAHFTRFQNEDAIAALHRHQLEAHALDQDGAKLDVVAPADLPTVATKALDDRYPGRSDQRAWHRAGADPVYLVRFARETKECVNASDESGRCMKALRRVDHEYLVLIDAAGKIVEPRELQ